MFNDLEIFLLVIHFRKYRYSLHQHLPKPPPKPKPPGPASAETSQPIRQSHFTYSIRHTYVTKLSSIFCVYRNSCNWVSGVAHKYHKNINFLHHCLTALRPRLRGADVSMSDSSVSVSVCAGPSHPSCCRFSQSRLYNVHEYVSTGCVCVATE